MTDEDVRLPYYIVQPGDSLWKLAETFLDRGTNWEQIRDANPHLQEKAKDTIINPGEKLLIPGASPRTLWIWQHSPKLDRDYAVISMRGAPPNDVFDAPYLRPPNADAALELNNLVLPSKNPLPEIAFSQGIFMLDWQTDPARTKPEKAVVVVGIAPEQYHDAVWAWELDTIQQTRQDFLIFCAEVERLVESEYPDVFIPGAADLIRARLAQNIPASIRDALFFQYRLNHGRGSFSSAYVDLVPGMRLRVEYGSYQMATVIGGGYSPFGEGIYSITRQSYRSLSIDLHTDYEREMGIKLNAYLAHIAAPQPTRSADESGGVLDMAAMTPQRHYRLLCPNSTTASNQSPVADAALSPSILGAPTLHALELATQDMQEDGDTSVPDVTLFVFRGRATPIPEIPVYVNGVQRFVPLGTTVQNVLDEALGIWNPVSAGGAFSMTRPYMKPDGMPDARHVTFHTGDLVEPAVYELPLILGDRIDIRN